MEQVLVAAHSAGESTAAARRLVRRGRRRMDDVDLSGGVREIGDGSTLVCLVVTTAADAQRALLCAASGYSLVVQIDEHEAVGLELLDALERIAPVERTGNPASTGPSALSETQVQLLTLLSDGATLTDAAATLYLSRRTANRRLTEARAFFGTTTHRQTVMAFAAHRRGPSTSS